MPVRTMDMMTRFLDDFSNGIFSSSDDSYPSSEPLLPDDIWKKFELDFPEFSGFDDILNESAMKSEDSLFPLISDICEIRNHDCMWAGHCGSKEHPADEPRHTSCFIPPTPVIRPPVSIKQENITNKPMAGQQSLLKPAVRAANTLMPQTPPMSDDEEVKTKSSQVLQILNQAINECDLDEDSDLCDYFDEEVEVVEPSAKQKEEEEKTNIRLKFAAESDHSYHKGKHASMSMENLGIDTPSDSEEEIDVVSVVQQTNRQAFNLPNNPSNKDRQQIQRRVATAISKRNHKSGNSSSSSTGSSSIKTILPVRKPSSPEYSPLKKKQETRGVKRPRQYKTAYTSCKRRQYSSDSEPEPSEKRSLHNNMERQRRIDLRNAFEDLRQLVPEVSKKERAAKVVILREASLYCDNLTSSHHGYIRYTDELKRKQEWLRSRVSQLRRSLAIKR